MRTKTRWIMDFFSKYNYFTFVKLNEINIFALWNHSNQLCILGKTNSNFRIFIIRKIINTYFQEVFIILVKRDMFWTLETRKQYFRTTNIRRQFFCVHILYLRESNARKSVYVHVLEARKIYCGAFNARHRKLSYVEAFNMVYCFCDFMDYDRISINVE